MTNELRAQAEWSRARPQLFHYRDRDGLEVDLVLESGDGRVVGIEVKAGATVRSEDLRGLRRLDQRVGDDFAAGVVLARALLRCISVDGCGPCRCRCCGSAWTRTA